MDLRKTFLFSILAILYFTSPAIAGGEGGGGLLSPNPGLAIWTLITFVVLLVVLKTFAWKPLIDSLENRTNYIENMIREAEEKNRQAEERLKEYENKIEEAKKEALEIIEEGKKDAVELAKKIEKKAEKDAISLKKQTQKELDLALTKAKEEIWKTTVSLSTTLAEKIMEKSLDSKDDQKIIENVLKQYEKN